MIPSFDPILWRRASWTVLVLSVVAFISLGLAEQGTRGGGSQTPPDAPLPFERHRVFGLDLSGMSSLQALDWLNAAGNPSLALVVVPIDSEVVQALGQDEGRDGALSAIDALLQTAGDSPLAVCLRKPPDTVGGLGIAQAAVGAINTRFPDRIVYVSACDPASDPGWQEDIAQAARPDAEEPISTNGLVPFSSGDVVVVHELNGDAELDADHLRVLSRGNLSLYRLNTAAPASAGTIARAAEAIGDATQAALILAVPTDGVDPAALAGSIAGASLPGGDLPEGFSSVDSPALTTNDGWQTSTVGTITYLRATETGAALAAEFVGTDVYLMGIESPDSGVIQVWVDPASPTAPPTAEIDLYAVQAHDAAIPIVRGLPAARHQLIVQAVAGDGTSVTVSGLFVTGRPATAWTGTMASAAVLLVAVIALSERCYTAVVAIRQRSGSPRRRSRPGHPRVFARDR